MGTIQYGIVGSVALVLGILAGATLTHEQASQLYYCDTSGQVGQFDKISSTGTRAYWTDATGQHYKDCKGSKWAEFQAIEDIPIQEPGQQSSAAMTYICSLERCQ